MTAAQAEGGIPRGGDTIIYKTRVIGRRGRATVKQVEAFKKPGDSLRKEVDSRQ